MRPKSLAMLRREAPERFVFSFMIATPRRKEATGEEGVLYQGYLPISTDAEMWALSAQIRKLILDCGKGSGAISGKKIVLRKPPKGMVRVKKADGEESA